MLTLVSLDGCASSRKNASSNVTSVGVPDYATIAEQYNARTTRLDRLWSRAVVQVRYTDEKGRARRQQGEGHLQVVQPHNVALSIGKLGEVLFWLGADSERFWIFELSDSDRVSVCRHDNVGTQCAQPMSVPVHPLTMMELLAITPLPPDELGTVTHDPELDRYVVDIPMGRGIRRMHLDTSTLLPRRVELYDAESSLVVWSQLDEYERIAMSGSPGFNPQVATRIQIDSSTNDAQVRVFLSDASDGVAIGRIPDAAFDFETLVRAHRPGETIVLDERCPTPSIATRTTRVGSQ